MVSLEHAVSRAILRARLMELALHSSGRWTISVGSHTVPATRTILSDRISFTAQFIGVPDGDVQVLDHDGIPIFGRSFSAPDFAPFTIEWEFAVKDEPAVAA